MDVQRPREIAARILERHEPTSRTPYLERRLERQLHRLSLSPADRRLLQELTYGSVRWQRLLDWLIDRKAHRGIRNKGVRVLLRLGLYQLFWLTRIPPHAAIHETVQAAKRLGHGAQAGFINALLRAYLREKAATADRMKALQSTDPALAFSHPDWLWRRWRTRWGDEATQSLMQWNNAPPPTFARVNHLLSSPARLLRQWGEEGVIWQPIEWEWTDPASLYELQSHPSLDSLESFRSGAFAIQDPSTLLAVKALGPQPGETILDLCAAPGGKTTSIAERIGNQGSIVALDANTRRLELLRANCRRLGVSCARIDTVSPYYLGEDAQYDRALVDVPCSNTGVLRRRVDLRWRLSEGELMALQAEQLRLLQMAVKALRPGGTLVYSTCSLEPEENEEVVEQFQHLHCELQLVATRGILPFRDHSDGAFVASWIRSPN